MTGNGTLRVTNASGVTIDLPALAGVTGRGAPDRRYHLDSTPGIGGARVRDVTDDVAEVVVPLLVHGDRWPVHADYAEIVNALADGPLELEDTETARWLACWQVAGLSRVEDLPTQATPTLLFVSDGPPVWRDRFTVSVEYVFDPAGGLMLPILPLVLSAVPFFADDTLTVAGGVATSEVTWTLTGPMSRFELLDVASGRRLAGDAPLAAGEQAVVDVDARTYTGPDAVNWFPKLTATDFWPLTPGTRSVRVSIDDPQDPTRVGVAWVPWWRTPWG